MQNKKLPEGRWRIRREKDEAHLDYAAQQLYAVPDAYANGAVFYPLSV